MYLLNMPLLQFMFNSIKLFQLTSKINMHLTLKYKFINQPMFIYLYIIPSILMSPIISISMNSWFMIWITLEFNMMTFIPMIIYFNKFFKNLAMKYFIIQSFSSSILIFCSNFMLLNYYMINLTILSIMNISLLIKIGSAPFHSWFLNMMNNLNWMSCLILSTWQKIIPFILIMYSFIYKILYISAILSSLIGAFFGINHQSIRMIMAYSSINHISWMLINLMISELLWTLYFISYLFINFSIMTLLNMYKIFFMNQMFFLKNLLINKLFIILNFLSISGLPPMFGFMMKWYSLYLMNYNNNLIIIMILIFMSIFTFLFYIRICLSLLIQFNYNNKFIMNNKFKYNYKKLKMFKLIIINSFLLIWLNSLWLF